VLVAREGGGRLEGIKRRRATRNASSLESNKLKCSHSSSLLGRKRCRAGEAPNSLNQVRVDGGSSSASSRTVADRRQPNQASASRKLTVCKRRRPHECCARHSVQNAASSAWPCKKLAIS